LEERANVEIGPEGNTDVRRRVGIMGGTFDPIHNGHLACAEEAMGQFDLDEVIFVPTGNPPHKANEQVTPARERLTMVHLATIGHPRFRVSPVEIDMPGPSYTAETLAYFRSELGEAAKLFFITGADAVLEILHWRDPEKLMSMCSIIAATRLGYSGERLQTFLEEVKRETNHEVLQMKIPVLQISSTDIRRRVRESKPIRYLVPQAVYQFIEKEGLYL